MKIDIILRGAQIVMVFVVGIGHTDLCSNPERISFYIYCAVSFVSVATPTILPQP